MQNARRKIRLKWGQPETGWPNKLRARRQQQVSYRVVAFFPRQFERGFTVFIGHVRIRTVVQQQLHDRLLFRAAVIQDNGFQQRRPADKIV